MAGFRTPEVPREQMVLWARRLEDAIPVDHPVWVSGDSCIEACRRFERNGRWFVRQ